MYIHEAVSTAISKGMCIKRSIPLPFWKKVKIEPTNSSQGCLLHSQDREDPSPRWQPKAEDLIADDWVLVSK